MDAEESQLAAIALLADPYALRVLQAVTDVALTAPEIVRVTRLPPAACYRRLRSLQAHGLVMTAGVVPTRNGRGARQFRARVSSVRVVYDGGQLHVSMDLREGGSREFTFALKDRTA